MRTAHAPEAPSDQCVDLAERFLAERTTTAAQPIVSKITLEGSGIEEVPMVIDPLCGVNGTVAPVASESKVSGPIPRVPLLPGVALEATVYWTFNRPKTSPELTVWAPVGYLKLTASTSLGDRFTINVDPNRLAEFAP